MNSTHWVVADIGGTNARFARAEPATLALSELRHYRCADFATLEDLIRDYLAHGASPLPSALCLAVPGVVEHDQVNLPNNHWRFSQDELRRSLNLDLKFINDFTAQLYATFTLQEHELTWLGDARPTGNLVRAAVGPGTGLGVKALTPKGGLVPSEGGHFAYAPLDAHEVELLQILWRRYERVSVERLCSGPGLSLLYWANSVLEGREAELPPPAVSAGALAGDALCLRAVNDFIHALGATAGDLALILGAFDGVYLMGDLLPKLAPLFDPAALRARFNAKGRYSELCANIPLVLVNAEHTGLRGCAQVLRAQSGLFTPATDSRSANPAQ
ncbi:MAG: glucokinase [Pseudomonadales bacterium]|jgi:glucokinase|nr:glucokinase [Pseudomonadales bacterium]